MATNKKVIITCALTGGIHGKEANPNLPEQPDEIVEQGLAAVAAGASILHCHVRTREGRPGSDVEIFREVQERFRITGTNAIIQLSTGGGIGVSFEERVKSITLNPEMCSFNMGLLSWLVWGGEHLFLNLRSDLVRIAQMIQEAEIKPELECYQLEQLDDVAFLVDKGLLDKPYVINFVLNTPTQGGIKGTPDNLILMYHRTQQLFPPDDYRINVSAIGSAQLPLTTVAMAMGLNARVGMEDNIRYSLDAPVQSNAQLVERAVRIARELDFEPAAPDEARKILGIKGKG